MIKGAFETGTDETFLRSWKSTRPNAMLRKRFEYLNSKKVAILQFGDYCLIALGSADQAAFDFPYFTKNRKEVGGGALETI